MKILYLFLLLFISSLAHSQLSSISSMEIIPASPTTSDSVKLVGNFTFSSGGCDQMLFSASVAGFNITSSAQYCLGALTVICTDSDTINLGLLPAGTYSLNLSLSSGAGPVPCTPGIAPDDFDTLSFTVTAPTHIEESAYSFELVPNPASSSIQLKESNSRIAPGELIRIYTTSGQLVQQESYRQNQLIDVSSLAKGMYYVQLHNQTRKLVVF